MVKKPYSPKDPRKCKKKPKRIKAVDPVRSARLKALWLTPEFKAKMAIVLANKKPSPGRLAGHPDGMSQETFLRKKSIALKETQRIMEHMAKDTEFNPDNNVANEALQATITLLRMPGENRNKLAAAKLLLEYTQKKPATASEVSLKKAEDFLDSILDDSSAS